MKKHIFINYVERRKTKLYRGQGHSMQGQSCARHVIAGVIFDNLCVFYSHIHITYR